MVAVNDPVGGKATSRRLEMLFLTLKIFSSTGGIEKVCRIAGKALDEIARDNNVKVKILSLHDRSSDIDDKYFDKSIFKGYRGRGRQFAMKSILLGRRSKIVILSHVNLLIVGYLIKLLYPKTKLILFAHGIEVWEPLSGVRRKMLLKCDKILAVSEYTRRRMTEANNLPEEKLVVFNNCLDPFLASAKKVKSKNLLQRYNLDEDNKVLVTLTRLSGKDKYKGYDHVLNAISCLNNEYPKLKYLLIGKYDDKCKERLDQLIENLGIQNKVIFTGFIPDEELADHFSLGDVYAMPSTKEGFGIVFIEAMYFGLPVIAGNKDGSRDALMNGQLGILIDPENNEDIISAIRKVLINPSLYKPDQEKLMKKFSYGIYKGNLLKVLKENVHETFN